MYDYHFICTCKKKKNTKFVEMPWLDNDSSVLDDDYIFG